MADVEMIRCPNCGAMNRAPREKMARGLTPVCGRCQTPLGAVADAPVTVTDATFGDLVERSALPVLVDLWAPWCGPCKMIAPAIDQVARELAGRLRVAKLNVDENPSTAARFGVQGIPSLLIIKNGREVDRIVGAVPKQEILRRVQPVL
jgi:thioredoxin 2